MSIGREYYGFSKSITWCTFFVYCIDLIYDLCNDYILFCGNFNEYGISIYSSYLISFYSLSFYLPLNSISLSAKALFYFIN
jgi:hypothetical protein